MGTGSVLTENRTENRKGSTDWTVKVSVRGVRCSGGVSAAPEGEKCLVLIAPLSQALFLSTYHSARLS